jgi:hypothetical protein
MAYAPGMKHQILPALFALIAVSLLGTALSTTPTGKVTLASDNNRLTPPSGIDASQSGQSSGTQAEQAQAAESESATGEDPATATHWLNTKTGVRHNSKCRFFKKTRKGRMCGPNEGKACRICKG